MPSIEEEDFALLQPSVKVSDLEKKQFLLSNSKDFDYNKSKASIRMQHKASLYVLESDANGFNLSSLSKSIN